MREHCTIPMRVCDFCGALFAREPRYLRYGQRFCSLACSRQGMRKRRPASPEDAAARFWSKVERGDGCWLWTGSTNPDGYGTVRYDGKSDRAHRVAWILTHGAIPDGLFCCHHCDRPACCRPDHLFLGTTTDNMRDMSAKGRHVVPSLMGERHPMARLTDAQVRAIRQRHANGEVDTRLAADFGMSLTQIGRIVRRELWTHIT